MRSFFSLHPKGLILLCAAILIFIAVAFVIFSRLFSSSDSTYTDTDFSLRYPKEHVLEALPIPGMGKSLEFHILKGSLDSLQLQVVTSKPGNDAQTIAGIYHNLGYQEAEVTVNGTVGKEFWGSTTIGEKLFQQRVAVFTHKGQIYKLSLFYEASQQDPYAEEIYKNILRSLQFH